MASITITVGPITATKTTTDATAQALLNDFIAAYAGPVNGTNQQKADWFVTQVVKYVREVANGQNVRSARDAAELTAQQTVNSRDWA